MSYSVTMIDNQDIADALPHVQHHLQKAIDAAHGRTDLPSLVSDLNEARASLWICYGPTYGIDAAIVTRVAKYPKKRMLLLEMCGGENMDKWLPRAAEVFRKFAIDCGLDGVEIYGRRGWSRALAAYGMRETIMICEADLRQGSRDVQ